MIHINPYAEEERYFRHYLFILDSLNTRIRQLEKDQIQFDSNSMTFDEYRSIIEKNDLTLGSDRKNKEKILTRLIKNRLYNKSLENTIIADSNWKYIELTNKPTRQNRHSWENLYRISFKSQMMPRFFSSYVSSFVHGLGISNFTFSQDYELHRQLIVYTNICYMNFTKAAIETLYRSIIQQQRIDFKNTPMALQLVHSMNDEYIDQKVREYLNTSNNN